MNNKKINKKGLPYSAGTRLTDGSICELVLKNGVTDLLSSAPGPSAIHSTRDKETKFSVRPIPASNNLIKHGVIKLPAQTEAYGDPLILFESVRKHIRRYCELSEDFTTLCASYVMMTWLYDRGDELPYLRLTGTYGTGKTRFLKVVGSLCYKALFASGASSIAPLFHALDTFRGTLILDEADYRFTDERAEITKLLNNGNVRGFPILRCQKNAAGAFSPQAYDIYGPKIVATRGPYEDPALESRFISETARSRSPESSVPLRLPPEFEAEAQTLRNQLLAYRFAHATKPVMSPDTLPDDLQDRIAQIFLPLLSIAPSAEIQNVIAEYAHVANEQMRVVKIEPERLALRAISTLLAEEQVLAVSALAKLSGVHPRSMGHILRNRLGIETVKRQGYYIIPETSRDYLAQLLQRWGVSGEVARKTSFPQSVHKAAREKTREAVIDF